MYVSRRLCIGLTFPPSPVRLSSQFPSELSEVWPASVLVHGMT